MLSLMLLLSMLSFQPCATEDSTNCYWNSSERGNGEGTSFIAFNDSTSLHFTTKEN